MALKPEEYTRLQMLQDKERMRVLARHSSGKDFAAQAVQIPPRALATDAGDQYDKLRHQIRPGQGSGKRPELDINSLRTSLKFGIGSSR